MFNASIFLIRRGQKMKLHLRLAKPSGFKLDCEVSVVAADGLKLLPRENSINANISMP